MGKKKGKTEDEPLKEDETGEGEDAIDLLDQINQEIGFVTEVIGLIQAAWLMKESREEISLIHVSEEMIGRLKKTKALCARLCELSGKEDRGMGRG
jgi:hypothetical protein